MLPSTATATVSRADALALIRLAGTPEPSLTVSLDAALTIALEEIVANDLGRS